MRETSSRETEVDREPSVTNVAGRSDGLPGKLLTAFEVAELVGCHEESVRRAYLCAAQAATVRR
jgi:hypothetical protein